jgi:hypothetical protein
MDFSIFALQKYTIYLKIKNIFFAIDCSVDKNVYVCNLITKKIVTKKVVIWKTLLSLAP